MSCSRPFGARHDPPRAGRPPGPRHPRGLRRRALPVGRAGVVRPPGREPTPTTWLGDLRTAMEQVRRKVPAEARDLVPSRPPGPPGVGARPHGGSSSGARLGPTGSRLGVLSSAVSRGASSRPTRSRVPRPRRRHPRRQPALGPGVRRARPRTATGRRRQDRATSSAGARRPASRSSRCGCSRPTT